MAYQETNRTIDYTSDGYEVELFMWRENSNDPWTPEVQLIEESASSPSGFWVYWNSDTSNYSEGTKDDFINASFPKKPVKRGGTPQSS